MLIFGLQLHWITLSIIILELILLVAQTVGFLSRPQDEKLGWQLLLLILVISRNTVEGLFQIPNPQLWMPILWQNFFGQGFGYLVAAYFPLYWYKTLDLPSLKFHGRYGFLFLLIPVILVYGLFYPVSQDLMSARVYVYIIPGSYGVFMLGHVCKAIHSQYVKDKNKSHRQTRILIFLAIIPWMTAPLIGVGLGQPQCVIDIALNAGFLVLNLLFVRHVVKQSRADLVRIKELETEVELYQLNKKFAAPISIPSKLNTNGKQDLNDSELFELVYQYYKFSPAEIRIVKAFQEGLDRKLIADKLNIDLKTVETHSTNIYRKTGIVEMKVGVSKRMQLLEKLIYMKKYII